MTFLFVVQLQIKQLKDYMYLVRKVQISGQQYMYINMDFQLCVCVCVCVCVRVRVHVRIHMCIPKS